MTTLDLWNDGPTRQSIIDFANRVSDPEGPDFVEPDSRVAVFDNDGTLWPEKPMVIQLDFTIRRFAALAGERPELQDRQPYKAAYENDLHWLGATIIKHYQGDDSDLQLLMAAAAEAFEAITVEDYDRRVLDFFTDATNPHLKRPYSGCGYAPMVQLLQYLETSGFHTYIASGGDRDFMRPVAGTLYGVPPERIIGSALGLTYSTQDGASALLYKGQMDFFDDGPEKPIRIWSRIGRRPILSCGNSNGDLPMLAWSGRSDQSALRLVILHDDADREFDYTTGAEKVLDAAQQQQWTVVSMKNDWNEVFTPVS